MRCNVRRKLDAAEGAAGLERMRGFAARRGGCCLSELYKNVMTKLLWACAKGHRWKATPNSIVRGSWCPDCSGRKRKTLRHMQELAARRGGLCLSESYKNVMTKLLWACAKGHRWETQPNCIRDGNWCPFCAKERRRSGRLRHTEIDLKGAP